MNCLWTSFYANGVTWAQTVPYIPPVTWGRVIRVYDGDTLTIATKLPHDSTYYRFSVRLKGIDCPEIKGSSTNEKECALIAKAKVEELSMGQVISLKDVQLDKYGRLLASVDLYGVGSLSAYLLKERLAVPYFGKTKKCPKDWMQYYKDESYNEFV